MYFAQFFQIIRKPPVCYQDFHLIQIKQAVILCQIYLYMIHQKHRGPGSFMKLYFYRDIISCIVRNSMNHIYTAG